MRAVSLPALALLAVVAVAPVIAGCPPRAATPAVSSPRPEPPVDTTALVIPVADAARAAATLDALAQRADTEPASAWVRIHYLLDLFDDARFRRDDASAALLARGLAGPSSATGAGARGSDDDALPRGAAATDAVLDALLVETDELLARVRGDGADDDGEAGGPAGGAPRGSEDVALTRHGESARTLLAFDREPPRRRAEVLRRIGQLKAVSRGGGPLADNARLRLAGYCVTALGDATAARWAERPERVAHCLYPLYDADPEPYFAAEPELRPPPPDWRQLAGELDAALAAIADGASRVARAAAHARTELAALRERADAFPAVPDLAALRLPAASGALPYDWTPLWTFARAEDVAALEAAREQAVGDLRMLVQGDGRRVVTVAAAGPLAADVVIRAGRMAREAGARTLGLGVVVEQTLVVPVGDYWSGRIQGDTLPRLGVIPLSLAVLDDDAPADRDWNQAASGLALHLVVSAAAWTLTSPDGQVAAIPASSADSDAPALLRATLRRVLTAFPDEDAVILVPGRDATVAALAQAAHAAWRDERGAPLVSRLGVRAAAPRVVRRVLARRIERRAGARVDIEPEVLAPRAAMIRRCYQSVLERAPRAGGAFRLERAGDRVAVTGGPRNPALRECLTEALANVMKADDVAAAAVTLHPR